ncbi:MAG: sodium:solute symporter family protein [Planctomycetes bacterium]|nr:sodium:solute symporter family protein [Planctomycetota bacterium]
MLASLLAFVQHAADPTQVQAMTATAAAGESPIFWVIVIGYFMLVLGFGAYFARFNRSTSDFFFGGRRFSWWLITMSIVATGVGSHSFLKYSSKGFEHGFSSSMTYMNDWFFVPLFMFGWLPIIYYMRVRSIPEYFERRFNPQVRMLATIALLLFMLGYIGIGFVTMAKTLSPILEPHLGWDLMTITWVVAIVAGVYITFGGQTAVIFTDLLQGFVLLFAGVFLFLLGLDFLGGFDAFWSLLPDEYKLPLANFNDDPSFNFVGIFWQDAVAGSIGFLFMNQGLIMRFMACRSVNEGRKAAAFNVLIALPISAIAVSNAGWIGRAISTAQPDLLSPDTVPDEVFVKVTALLTTPAGFGFFVAAVTAALMSTVDTLINAVAAVTINDVYRPFKERGGSRPNDKHYLRDALVVSAIATLIGVGAAWGFSQFESLYEAHGFFQSTLTPPLVAAIFLAIFWKRFTTAGAVATFIMGGVLIVLGNQWPTVFIEPLAHGVPAPGEGTYRYIGALWNLVACFGTGILVSLFTRHHKSESIDGLTMWSIESARRFFKGGEPNDRTGFAMKLRWERLAELPEGVVQVDRETLKGLAADGGEIVYVTDARGWLGGLRSTHAKVMAEPHDHGEVVYVSSDVADTGHFLPGRMLKVEKEM